MSKRIKLKLKAQAATADDYGRLRFLLLDQLNDGKRDFSAATLKRAIPFDSGAPFKLWEARDNVVGEFWVTIPKARAARTEFWKTTYVAMRGKEVIVEVALRKYRFVQGDKQMAGVSLDLQDLELAAKEEKKN